MSESQPSKSLFLVVDSEGGRTAVSSDRMCVDEQRVEFLAGGQLVAAFNNPVSAVAVTAGVSRTVEAVPSEAVCAIRSRWAVPDWLLCGALVVNVVVTVCGWFVIPG